MGGVLELGTSDPVSAHDFHFKFSVTLSVFSFVLPTGYPYRVFSSYKGLFGSKEFHRNFSCGLL